MELETIRNTDPQIAYFIEEELKRQQNTIELIASENFTSPAVMACCGSILTNKYAEGKPYKRYYNGCEFIDKIEELAAKRCCEIFKCDHANVQPHSGAQANMAVFMYALKTGDTIMGMDLSNGGHLTHGSPVNFSGINYKVVSYGVDEDGVIDYADVEKKALEYKPKMIIAGASNYSRIIDFEKFSEIAKKVGAYLMVDIAHIAGLVATGLHPSPVRWADFVTTTTHKTLRGPRGGIIMCKQEHAQGIDKAVFPGVQGGPLEHIIAGKAVALKEVQSEEYKQYARQVVENSACLADELIKNGIDIVGGKSENHVMTIDLRRLNKTGKDVANLLEEVGITANKNTVPNDPQSPFVTSGVRIGTPATTTRGMKTPEMKEIAKIISDAILEKDTVENLRKRSKLLCDKFPLYKNIRG